MQHCDHKADECRRNWLKVQTLFVVIVTNTQFSLIKVGVCGCDRGREREPTLKCTPLSVQCTCSVKLDGWPNSVRACVRARARVC